MTVPPPEPRARSAVRGRRAVTTQSIAETVVEAIDRRITEERLPAGHRIGTKDDLCTEYGVAPATLGEALRVLRGRDVIEVRPGPGGGIFVAHRSPLIALAHHVLQLRRNGATVNDVVGVLDALDEAIVRDAVTHRTAADLADLDRLMDDLAIAWADRAEGLRLTWRLHRRIAEITPNIVLRTFYQDLVDYIESESPAEPDQPFDGSTFRRDSDERLQVHRDLVEAIRARDHEAARTAAEHHRGDGSS